MDTFYDLFMLCLWWQWNPNDTRSMYTTVDKVLAVLVELNIISKEARDLLQDSDAMERRLMRSMMVRSTGQFPGNADQRRSGILKSRTHLVAYGPQYATPGGISHVMFDARIYLTWWGAKYAERIQGAYLSILTRNAYLRENERRKEAFQELSGEEKAVIMWRYRNRVSTKTKDRRTSHVWKSYGSHLVSRKR